MDYMNTAAADICARQEGTNVVYVEGAIKGEGSKWPSYTALPIAGQCNTHSKEECICISFIILRIIYIKRVIWNEDNCETKYITNYLGSKNQFFPAEVNREKFWLTNFNDLYRQPATAIAVKRQNIWQFVTRAGNPALCVWIYVFGYIIMVK